MKYIKQYETINWDFDEEEVEPLNVSDIVTSINNTPFEWWGKGKWMQTNITNGLITEIKHTSIINKHYIGKIPYNGYMCKLRGGWPWFKMNNLQKIKKQ